MKFDENNPHIKFQNFMYKLGAKFATYSPYICFGLAVISILGVALLVWSVMSTLPRDSTWLKETNEKMEEVAIIGVLYNILNNSTNTRQIDWLNKVIEKKLEKQQQKDSVQNTY